MIFIPDTTSIGLTKVAKIALAGVAAVGTIFAAGADIASAGYRPAFSAPVYRPAPVYSAPVYRMPVFQPAPRPFIAPVMRPMSRPFVAPVIRPAARPIIQAPYRAPAPRVTQPAVQPFVSKGPAVSSGSTLRFGTVPTTASRPALPAPAPQSNLASVPGPSRVQTVAPIAKAAISHSPAPSPVAKVPQPTASLPSASTIAKVPQSPLPGIVTTVAQSTPSIAKGPPPVSNVVNGVVKAAQTTPGKITIDTINAMIGGAATTVAPNSMAIKTLSRINDVVGVASATKSGGGFGATNEITKQVITGGATFAGQVVGASSLTAAGTTAGSVTMTGAIAAAAVGGALAAGTAVASYEVGEHYIAPKVAPWLGDKIFNAAPGLFTPASQANVSILAANSGQSRPLTADDFSKIILK